MRFSGEGVYQDNSKVTHTSHPLLNSPPSEYSTSATHYSPSTTTQYSAQAPLPLSSPQSQSHSAHQYLSHPTHSHSSASPAPATHLHPIHTPTVQNRFVLSILSSRRLRRLHQRRLHLRRGRRQSRSRSQPRVVVSRSHDHLQTRRRVLTQDQATAVTASTAPQYRTSNAAGDAYASTSIPYGRTAYAGKIVVERAYVGCAYARGTRLLLVRRKG